MFKPRSPKEKYNNIVALPRLFDKIRAEKAGTLGDYKVGPTSELDKQLQAFLGFDFDLLLSQSDADQSDEYLFNTLVQTIPDKKIPDEGEVNTWSETMLNMKLAEDPERVPYRNIVIEKMNLSPEITTFDWLEMTDNM